MRALPRFVSWWSTRASRPSKTGNKSSETCCCMHKHKHNACRTTEPRPQTRVAVHISQVHTALSAVQPPPLFVPLVMLRAKLHDNTQKSPRNTLDIIPLPPERAEKRNGNGTLLSRHSRRREQFFSREGVSWLHTTGALLYALNFSLGNVYMHKTYVHLQDLLTFSCQIKEEQCKKKKKSLPARCRRAGWTRT